MAAALEEGAAAEEEFPTDCAPDDDTGVTEEEDSCAADELSPITDEPLEAGSADEEIPSLLEVVPLESVPLELLPLDVVPLESVPLELVPLDTTALDARELPPDARLEEPWPDEPPLDEDEDDDDEDDEDSSGPGLGQAASVRTSRPRPARMGARACRFKDMDGSPLLFGCFLGALVDRRARKAQRHRRCRPRNLRLA
jgi:hypothetical protein